MSILLSVVQSLALIIGSLAVAALAVAGLRWLIRPLHHPEIVSLSIVFCTIGVAVSGYHVGPFIGLTLAFAVAVAVPLGIGALEQRATADGIPHNRERQ
ncbi:MAG: hypothetical protein JF593_14180 [Novosphingobium sp.]|nr:hypothetical protein [Novosphingobium sp.]